MNTKGFSIIAAVCIVLTVRLGAFQAPSISAEDRFYNQDSPSKAIYTDWINRNWLPSNERKVLSNLEFFKWLHQDYGMQLDIYLVEVPFDNGLHCRYVPGRTTYGSLESPWFKDNFPKGLRPLSEKAQSFGCNLGIWMGPDGFGDTPETAQQRVDLLVSLCRDYGVRLFKFDACASGLRREKEKYFIQALQQCRRYSPDLVVLTHRIPMSEEAKKQATTTLWQGQETYIDVSLSNPSPATHHRVATLSRGLPPNLQRLMEDCGVCLSSALDYWDDDVVLQAFNRNLILAPEIYGNPWLLRDNEFPKLARIFELHRKYNDILPNGIVLPEESYGQYALARGDGSTRFLTLRNLTWEPIRRKVRLDSSIGLSGKGDVELRQYHPTERFLGIHKTGSEVEVEVQPFRSCLLMATTEHDQEPAIQGSDYQVIKSQPGQPMEVTLLGMPGTNTTIRLSPAGRAYANATLDGVPIPGLVKGEAIPVAFPGQPLRLAYHRKIADMQAAPVPGDAEALYEADCFASDSNALEVRSLFRSGPTRIPAVNAARNAFFEDPVFVGLGPWDKFAFDGNMATAFKANRTVYSGGQEKVGALRIDARKPVRLTKLVLKGVPKDYVPGGASVSQDLRTWTAVTIARSGADVAITITPGRPVRYIRVAKAPIEIAEIEAYNLTKPISREGWKASNLFRLYSDAPAHFAWKARFKPGEIAANSHLAIAIAGSYGIEGAYAAVRDGGRILGAPDRSPSYPYNNFEHYATSDGNYTYYVPLDRGLALHDLEVVVLGFTDQTRDVKPRVWITAYPAPFESKRLVIGGGHSQQALVP